MAGDGRRREEDAAAEEQKWAIERVTPRETVQKVFLTRRTRRRRRKSGDVTRWRRIKAQRPGSTAWTVLEPPDPPSR